MSSKQAVNFIQYVLVQPVLVILLATFTHTRTHVRAYFRTCARTLPQAPPRARVCQMHTYRWENYKMRQEQESECYPLVDTVNSPTALQCTKKCLLTECIGFVKYSGTEASCGLVGHD